MKIRFIFKVRETDFKDTSSPLAVFYIHEILIKITNRNFR